MATHIQDAIHGYIRLNDLEEQVIDTGELQRLRRVRQLGFTSVVYPSATHTRFEHSLGALHVASQFAESLGVSEGRAQELRLAGLLHDVGHGPFSHSTDHLFHRHGLSHEHFSKKKIRESEIADVLHDYGIHPDRVVKLISGKSRLGGIIAGHIDVDRVDYLMRDAHYSGVAYGTIDAGTIIRSARLHDGELVFDGKYVNALESLLTARYLMIPTVYMHRTSRIASTMFREAFRLLRKDGKVTVEELPYMDEPELLHRLRRADRSAWLMERIDNRQLYKIAVRNELDEDVDRRTMEKQFQENTGLDEGEVLVDVVQRNETKTPDVPVLVDGRVRRLADVSHLPDALRDSLQQRDELRVYTAREHVNDVAAAATSIL